MIDKMFPENVDDLVRSALMNGITSLGFSIRNVQTTYPEPLDDFQSDRVIFWGAEIEIMVPQKGSVVEIAGKEYKETAPEWVGISSRLHFLPQVDDSKVPGAIIQQTATRSGAFSALVAMRPDRHYIYQAISDFGIYNQSLFVAEALRLGMKTIETGSNKRGKLMDPAKAIQWMEKFMRESITNRLIDFYKRKKSEQDN